MPRKRASDLPPGAENRHYLKAWREFRGLRQNKVAAMIGECPSSLSQLESGKQGYTQWKLETLARIYRTDPASLLSVNPFETTPADDELHRIWLDLRKPEREQALGHLKLIRNARPADK